MLEEFGTIWSKSYVEFLYTVSLHGAVPFSRERFVHFINHRVNSSLRLAQAEG